MMYRVTVEKRLYLTGTVVIDAKSVDEAQVLVEKQITSGELQTTAIVWNEPTYEDMSFGTTGEVDKIESTYIEGNL